MGRLTLNVLLSFAQFEREVIGERVRDKIAASKRKGIWVGGPVPLGYRCIDKKLEVVPEEAETVRIIFRRYLDLGSMGALIEDLDRRGIRTKAVSRLSGRVRGGIRFGVGALAHLLKNRFYLGEVVYRGEVHAGEHDAILDRDLFHAVQAKIAANAVARKIRLRGSPSILAGRIYDDRGNRMSPTHSNKLGVRYRYYVSHALLQNRKQEAASVARVPAPEIEQLVLSRIRPAGQRMGNQNSYRRRDPEPRSVGQPGNLCLDGVRAQLRLMELPAAAADRDLIERHVDRVIATPQAVEVRLISSGLTGPAEPGAEESAPSKLIPGTLMLPWATPSFEAVKGIVHEPTASSLSDLAQRAGLGRIGALIRPFFVAGWDAVGQFPRD